MLLRRRARLLAAAVLAAGLVGGVGPALYNSASADEPASGYLVGTGIADITGEAAEVGMMGYGALDQKTSGIHQRQRSRAFVFADRASGKRVAVVNTDLQGVFQSVHQAVLKRLAARFGNRYTEQNTMISATHTHGGPGGMIHYALYNLTVLGFQEKTFNAIVDGIVESIDQADAQRQAGHPRARPQPAHRRQRATGPGGRSTATPPPTRRVFPLGIDPNMTALRVRQGAPRRRRDQLVRAPTAPRCRTRTR